MVFWKWYNRANSKSQKWHGNMNRTHSRQSRKWSDENYNTVLRLVKGATQNTPGISVKYESVRVQIVENERQPRFKDLRSASELLTKYWRAPQRMRICRIIADPVTHRATVEAQGTRRNRMARAENWEAENAQMPQQWISELWTKTDEEWTLTLTA